MEQKQQQAHFLLLTFPAQGHINPALQFAKRLTGIGARVTFATTISSYRLMPNTATSDDGLLSFSSFSDGYDGGFTSSSNKPDSSHFMSEFKRRSTEALVELIKASQNQNQSGGGARGGQPFTCLVYSLLLPWTAEVAREFHLPSALLWLQPALVFDVYYYFFYGYGDLIKEKVNNNELIELPGLPPLISSELPSFMDPTKSNDTYSLVLPAFKEQMETIVGETNPRILVNTFDALEPEALTAIEEKFNMIAVGPLVPSEGEDLCKNHSKVDGDDDIMEWLRSKRKSSVIYVAFGSICVLEKRQMEEIARGLLDSNHPFLWVIRENNDKEKKEEDIEEVMMRKYKEELNEKGSKIVAWCSQVEVLSHEAVGCFVTHCGWSSSLESIVAGVPVVAFPQWTDQGTNAKIVVDLCKKGVRVKANEETGIVGSDEIKRCLELVMGDQVQGHEMRGNALKWKDLATEAAKQGGSSHENIRAFLARV